MRITIPEYGRFARDKVPAAALRRLQRLDEHQAESLRGTVFDWGFKDHVRAAIKGVMRLVTEGESLILKNRIFLDRLEGVGRVSPELALSYSWSGPCLRSTGVAYDVLSDPNPRSGSATLVSFNGGDAWQQTAGFRLVLAEPAPGETGPPPHWDPAARVLTVFLGKGRTAVVPLSSYATPADLALSQPHRRVLALPAGERDALTAFLRELDGSATPAQTQLLFADGFE